MKEIKKPNKRTFWKVNTNGKELTGFTDIDQVTTSAFDIESSDNADDIYPQLPSIGTFIEEGDVYSYEGGMVRVRQSHNRTNFTPKETPNLFEVYRKNTEGAEWIANESVIIGDKRTYNGQTYICIQSHNTQEDWQPPSVPALWELVIETPTTNEWAVGVSYTIGDEVIYNGITYVCRQSHTSISGWQPPNVLALWLPK